ncbi:MAG TPA: hypothetical protein VIZ67_02655 [Acidimicrobiales bacterium]|jgi:hypothetical protein
MTKFVNRQSRADEPTEARQDAATREAFADRASRMAPVAAGSETDIDPEAHKADLSGSGDTRSPDAIGGLRRARQHS